MKRKKLIYVFLPIILILIIIILIGLIKNQKIDFYKIIGNDFDNKKYSEYNSEKLYSDKIYYYDYEFTTLYPDDINIYYLYQFNFKYKSDNMSYTAENVEFKKIDVFAKNLYNDELKEFKKKIIYRSYYKDIEVLWIKKKDDKTYYEDLYIYVPYVKDCYVVFKYGLENKRFSKALINKLIISSKVKKGELDYCNDGVCTINLSRFNTEKGKVVLNYDSKKYIKGTFSRLLYNKYYFELLNSKSSIKIKLLYTNFGSPIEIFKINNRYERAEKEIDGKRIVYYSGACDTLTGGFNNCGTYHYELSDNLTVEYYIESDNDLENVLKDFLNIEIK